MPEPKSSFIPLAYRLQQSINNDQTLVHAHQFYEPGPYCICTPKAILAATRGQERPLCEAMPWQCPVRHAE